MPDRHDDLDSWLDGRIEPLPPAAGHLRPDQAAGPAPQVPQAGRHRGRGGGDRGRRGDRPAGGQPAGAEPGHRHRRRREPERDNASTQRGASTSSSSAVPYPSPPAPVPRSFPAHLGHLHRHGHRLGRSAHHQHPGHCATPVLHLDRADRRCREDLDRGARAGHRTGRRGHRGEPGPVPQPVRRLGVRARAVRDARRWPAPGPRWVTNGLRVTGLETVGEPRVRAVRLLHRDRGGVRGPVHQLHAVLLPAAADAWAPVGPSTSGLDRGAAGASLVLTTNRGYLLAPDGMLYAGLVDGSAPWQAARQVPCPVGTPLADGQPTGALLAAATAANLVLVCASSSAAGEPSRPSGSSRRPTAGSSGRTPPPRPPWAWPPRWPPARPARTSWPPARVST